MVAAVRRPQRLARGRRSRGQEGVALFVLEPDERRDSARRADVEPQRRRAIAACRRELWPSGRHGGAHTGRWASVRVAGVGEVPPVAPHVRRERALVQCGQLEGVVKGEGDLESTMI